MTSFEAVPAECYEILADYLAGKRSPTEAQNGMRRLAYWIRTVDEQSLERALKLHDVFIVARADEPEYLSVISSIEFVISELTSKNIIDSFYNDIELSTNLDFTDAAMISIDIVSYLTEFHRNLGKMIRRASIASAFDYIVKKSGIPGRDYPKTNSDPWFRGHWYLYKQKSTLLYLVYNFKLRALVLPPSHPDFERTISTLVADREALRNFLGQLQWLRQLLTYFLKPAILAEDEIALVPLSIQPVSAYLTTPMPSFLARARRYKPLQLR